MADYRFCTNLPTFQEADLEKQGGKIDGLLQCTKTGGYFDDLDTNFLAALADYKIGDPIQAEDDPTGLIQATPVAQLKANGFVGVYTTLEAIMTPQARRLIGWLPTVLGQSYVEL